MLHKWREQGSSAGCVKTAKIKPVKTGVQSLEATGKKSTGNCSKTCSVLVQFNENEHGTELATALEKK